MARHRRFDSTERQSADRQIALEIKRQRLLAGVSQLALAKDIGVSCQQLHKYEVGSDRISATSLFRIAKHLSVPVKFLFEGLSYDSTQKYYQRARKASARDRISFKLVAMLSEINDHILRDKLRSLIEVLASEPAAKHMVPEAGQIRFDDHVAGLGNTL